MPDPNWWTRIEFPSRAPLGRPRARRARAAAPEAESWRWRPNRVRSRAAWARWRSAAIRTLLRRRHAGRPSDLHADRRRPRADSNKPWEAADWAAVPRRAGR